MFLNYSITLAEFDSMNVYLETPPMKKFLIRLNINTRKPLETVDVPNFELNFNKTSDNHTKRDRELNIISFSPPFCRAVSANVEKRFIQLLRHHFSLSNKLHKIFNKNTVKVSYSYTQKVVSIVKSHNKKLINTSIKNTLQFDCKKKHEYPLDPKCRTENILYK